jgi:hypothetical protein
MRTGHSSELNRKLDSYLVHLLTMKCAANGSVSDYLYMHLVSGNGGRIKKTRISLKLKAKICTF